MKIKNFKYFSKRLAKEIGTTIKRFECGESAVWFDNGYYMVVDDDSFIYIADCSTDIPIKIMDTFACVYNTQKDFFREFKMIISTIETSEPEEPEISETSSEPEEPEISETSSEPEVTEAPEEPDETNYNTIDEKRQTYLSVYRDLQHTISHLQKCNTPHTYDICIMRYIKNGYNYSGNKISKAMLTFIQAKLSMQNVESGIWASEYERATGYHKSRRYNKNRVDA